MPNKIVFFNHYHRGDLHTSKEFIKQIQTEAVGFEFEYLHNNPDILTNEFNIVKTGTPEVLEYKTPFYQDENVLYVNSWVGCNWDIFCKHGGINMQTLYESWGKIFETINEYFNLNLKLKESKEEYLPRVDYSFAKTDNIEKYLQTNKRRILICNNVPASNQSFNSDMQEEIILFARKNTDTDFICTNKISHDLNNIKFVDDIIGFNLDCNLLEISYLSKYCDVIIGKNSGPYVFCETYDNYMNAGKTFVSFNKKHPDYEKIVETMSNDLNLKCKYYAVPILSPQLMKSDRESILAIMEQVV